MNLRVIDYLLCHSSYSYIPWGWSTTTIYFTTLTVCECWTRVNVQRNNALLLHRVLINDVKKIHGLCTCTANSIGAV